jgi:hypothetical protein
MMQASTATTTNHVPPLLTAATVAAVIISASATAHGRPLLCALWQSFAWFFDFFFLLSVVITQGKELLRWESTPKRVLRSSLFAAHN